MKVTEYEPTGVAVFDVDVSLMQEAGTTFRNRLDDVISRGYRNIVLDMTNTSYMNSVSISIMLEAQRKLKDSGGDIVLSNVNQLIRNLFEITNMTSIIRILPDNESALHEFRKAI